MNPTPEQLASAIKTITDAFEQGQLRGMFVARPLYNDINLIVFPGYNVNPDTEQDIEQIVHQLYQAAMQTPKSHLGTIILNVAAAMCAANPEINKLFMQDIGKKQAQIQFDEVRREFFKDK